LQTGGMLVGSGANGLAIVLAFTAVACLVFVVSLVMAQGRESPVAPPQGETPKKAPPREDV
jgi:hypothetical protein